MNLETDFSKEIDYFYFLKYTGMYVVDIQGVPKHRAHRTTTDYWGQNKSVGPKCFVCPWKAFKVY